MGSQEICAFCDDKEQEENNINQTNNFSYKGKTVKFKEEELIQEESPLSFRFIPSGIDYSKIISDFGIIKWSNNSIFKGYFKNNIPNGWGIYFHHINGTFKGEYYNDQPNGFGIFTHQSDSTYIGYWKNERQDGIGEEKWPEGMAYIGEFSMGKKNGMGKYIFPNGNIYYGEWEQNLMNGYGIYLFDQSKIYIGEWLNGLKDGYGEIYGQNNNYFFGYFRNNNNNKNKEYEPNYADYDFGDDEENMNYDFLNDFKDYNNMKLSDGQILAYQELKLRELEKMEEQKNIEKEKIIEEKKESNKIKENLKQEPNDDNPDKCIILFRFPDGEKSVQRKFLKQDKIKVLYDFIKSLGRDIFMEEDHHHFSLLQTFPYKLFDEIQNNTLEQEGLFPNSVLQIKEID